MINNLEIFLKEATDLLTALNEYAEATDRLLEIDLEQEEFEYAVDDIGNIIEEREEIRERADVALGAMTQAVGQQNEDDIEFIKCVFEGQEIEYAVTGDKKLCVEAIYKLLAMQKNIIDKDSAIIAKLGVKQVEIKNSLKNLQGDKKKLDFLNLSAIEEQDSGFTI
jgi:UDP-N-acetylmuramate-alanine ligase